MRYRVVYDSEVIGTSDLAACDGSMGVIFGDFVPTPAYERVRAVFRMFAENCDDQDPARYESYYAARGRTEPAC